MNAFFFRLRLWKTLATTIFCLWLSGCGDTARTAAPVDPGQARTTLKAALNAWKEGRSPSDLRSRSPEIVAQDADWQRGMKLTDYEVLGNGDERDANLECRVKLKMVDKQGKPVERTVTYVVGTDPVLTVFRKVEL